MKNRPNTTWNDTIGTHPEGQDMGLCDTVGEKRFKDTGGLESSANEEQTCEVVEDSFELLIPKDQKEPKGEKETRLESKIIFGNTGTLKRNLSPV